MDTVAEIGLRISCSENALQRATACWWRGIITLFGGGPFAEEA